MTTASATPRQLVKRGLIRSGCREAYAEELILAIEGEAAPGLRAAAKGVVDADYDDPMPEGWLMHSRIAALRAALPDGGEGQK